MCCVVVVVVSFTLIAVAMFFWISVMRLVGIFKSGLVVIGERGPTGPYRHPSKFCKIIHPFPVGIINVLKCDNPAPIVICLYVKILSFGQY